jgi:4-carboxymuconolactone decarboxylase
MQMGGGAKFDLEERMDEIVGSPPRIAALSEDEMTDEVREICRIMRASFGIAENGVIPEVLRLMLRHPGLFDAQMKMGILLAGKNTIPARERELAILRNAWLIGAPYEWGEHVDIGKRFGVTAEEIERCTIGSSAQGWSEHDRAVIKGVEELVANYMISDETWATLAQTWNEQQLMEFPVLVGQYISTALQQNSLRVRLADDNPGFTHR